MSETVDTVDAIYVASNHQMHLAIAMHISAITHPMIHRRTLLRGTAGLAAGSLLSGCNNRATGEDDLSVTLLEGAIPSEVIQKFRQQASSAVDFQIKAQMYSVFQQLQQWQRSPTRNTSRSNRESTRENQASENTTGWRQFLPWIRSEKQLKPHNLVSLGDYWLQSAIAQDLIEPLPLTPEEVAPLPVQWQQFVSRNLEGQMAPDSTESVLWAAPYKVQSLVIVYRQRANNPTTFKAWSDLLSPALKGQIALPDHPNLVLGLLQKIQTGSFNIRFDSQANSHASTAQLVKKLSQELAQPFSELHQQVRTYDAKTALKALVNEDLQAIVTWSGDVVSALQRYRSLRAVIPEEGSLLSADMWVRPKGARLNDQSKAWIDFCWQTGPATQLSVSGAGISPIFLTGEALPDTLAKGLLSEVTLENSEPLLPLPEAMQAAYFELWQQLRSQTA